MEPFSWNELKKFHCKYLEIVIPRKTEVLCQYENDKQNGICQLQLDKIKDFLKINNFLINENSYPYNIDKNVQHCLFWFSKGYTMNDTLQIAYKYFNTHNIIIMCNIQSLKSVIDIEHYHLFILNI